MRKIILASASPRRKEIMRKLFGEDFLIEESGYQEDNSLDLAPEELVKTHAREKARNVSADGIIIAADSIVVHNGEIIGKPKSKEDAVKTLEKIKGSKILVYTGVTVKSEQELTEYEVTEVEIENASREEIDKYVSTSEPLDRAGAFAADGLGSVFIKKVNGCYYNVVGLPIHRLANMLKKVDIDVLDNFSSLTSII